MQRCAFEEFTHSVCVRTLCVCLFELMHRLSLFSLGRHCVRLSATLRFEGTISVSLLHSVLLLYLFCLSGACARQPPPPVFLILSAASHTSFKVRVQQQTRLSPTDRCIVVTGSKGKKKKKLILFPSGSSLYILQESCRHTCHIHSQGQCL